MSRLSPKVKLFAMAPTIMTGTVLYIVFLYLVILGLDWLYHASLLPMWTLEYTRLIMEGSVYTIPLLVGIGLWLWGYWSRNWIRQIRGDQQ